MNCNNWKLMENYKIKAKLFLLQPLKMQLLLTFT